MISFFPTGHNRRLINNLSGSDRLKNAGMLFFSGLFEGLHLSFEMDFRDFLLSGEEVESSELVDILFLLFPNSSVMNSAICRYRDLGYRKKVRTAPISVFSPLLLVSEVSSLLAQPS